MQLLQQYGQIIYAHQFAILFLKKLPWRVQDFSSGAGVLGV